MNTQRALLSLSPLHRAQQYAAEVRQRNKPPCQCDACIQAENLAVVQRIIEARSKQVELQ
jgi:hypothetical protein